MDRLEVDSLQIVEQCSARILHPRIVFYREFFATLTETVHELFEATHAIIWDYNTSINKAIAIEQVPKNANLVSVPWAAVDELLSREVFLNPRSLAWVNVHSALTDNAPYNRAALIEQNCNHLTAIPILDPIVPDRAIGAIELFFAKRSVADERAAKWLSRATGRALDYLSLRVDASIRNDVDGCATQHLGMSPFFDYLAERVRQLCGCSHIRLYRYDDKTDKLTLERSTVTAGSSEEPRSSGVSADQDIYLACVKGHKPFVQAQLDPITGPPKLRIAVPILSPTGGTIGAIKLTGALLSSDPFIASSWNVGVLQSFAKAVAPTLERRWQLSDGQLLKQVINDVAVAVATEENLDYLLNKTLIALGDELRATMGSIYILEDGPDGPELVMRAGIGPDKALVGRARYRIGEGITGDIAKRREILNFKTHEERLNYRARKGKYSTELNYPSLESTTPAFLGVPIILGGRLLGVWKIEYIQPSIHHPDRYFTAEDERIVQIISSLLACAIENPRFGILARNLETFADGSLAIERAATEDEAVLQFMDALGRSSFDSAMISLLGPDNIIRGKWFAGKRFEQIFDKTVRDLAGNDILAEVLRGGKPVLVADSRNDHRCDKDAIKESGLISQYVLPLAAGDEQIGTVQIDLGEHPKMDTYQQQLLNSFAGHLTVTISRIRAMQQLDALTQQVTRSARFIVAEELSGWAVHSFTRRLGSVVKQLRTDLEQQEIRSNRVLFDTLTKWKATFEEASKDLGSALESVKTEGAMQGPYNADAHVEIQTTINLWYAYLKHHRVSIVLTLKAKNRIIDLAPHALRELLSVLIVNAVEAFAHEIRIETYDMNDAEAPTRNFIHPALCIDVTDDGHGIGSITDRDRLFESNFTTKKKIGTGLGLFIARRLARRGGGDLILPDQPSKGAKFRAVLQAVGVPEASRK